VTLLPSHWSVVHGLPSSVHAVPLAFFTSAGHAVLEPVQLSARSHSPAAARHSVPAATNASAGHVALDPVHVSATSQTPAAARQTAPAFPAGCVQSALLPSHRSSVQGLVSAVHAVPAACAGWVHAGALVLPLQTSFVHS
jgi:hypothetical protein